MMLRRAAILGLLWLCGCPANPSGDNSSGSSETPCAAHTAWEDKCTSGMGDPSGDPGWGAVQCPTLPWRYVQSQWISAMSDCLDTLACSGSDDTCSTAGYEAIGIHSEADVEDDTQLRDCSTRAVACNVSEDVCSLFPAFTEAGRNAAAHCLETTVPCSELEACLLDPDSI